MTQGQAVGSMEWNLAFVTKQIADLNVYYRSTFWITSTPYFTVQPTVKNTWNFYIGGYQPAQKWLKGRKGKILGYDDIRHYQRIIRVLKETGEIIRNLWERRAPARLCVR